MTAPIVNPLPYDKTSPESILAYAQFLKGKTFWEVLEKDPNLTNVQKEIIKEKFSKKTKGRYGHFIEENFFYYNKNSDSEADFPEAGVELKVTPYLNDGKKGELRAKERLVLTKINYFKDYDIPFEKSHLLEKCSLMLFIYYLYDKNKANEDYLINYVDLFQFPKPDYEIIKSDYNKIINKIKDGKAHELSESDTIYLGACTKAADGSILTKQPNSDIDAKPRAFCLKNSYMSMILNKYLAKGIHTYKPLDTMGELVSLKKDIITYGNAITDNSRLEKVGFENYIIGIMSKFYGIKVSDLIQSFGIKSEAKSMYYMLAKKMLGVNEDKIEEFEKANIEIKTIRLQQNGVPKEAMSFPAFKYMDIINQDFYDSDLYNIFSEKKFLFMVFQFTDSNYKDKSLGNLVFKKAMFWNVPMSDIEGKIKDAWEETVKKIKGGEYNNLVKASHDMIIHVRPHARNAEDTFPTPDGGKATKKCFWFNQKYIKEQIEKEG